MSVHGWCYDVQGQDETRVLGNRTPSKMMKYVQCDSAQCTPFFPKMQDSTTTSTGTVSTKYKVQDMNCTQSAEQAIHAGFLEK